MYSTYKPIDRLLATIFRSKSRLKLWVNALLLGLAIFYICLAAVWIKFPQVIDRLGKVWITVYHDRYASEHFDAISRAILGDFHALERRLQSHSWRSIMLEDRAWSYKRSMLRRLADAYHDHGKYDELAELAAHWKSLNPRDIDAIAFWYEAQRRSVGTEREGEAGLERYVKLFPKNGTLVRFYEMYRNEPSKVSSPLKNFQAVE